MLESTFVTAVALPIGLGLVGFIEPCTLGSSLLFIKYLEDKTLAARLAHTGIFVAVRALLIGSLGAVAAVAGTVFLTFQKLAWFGLGTIYLMVGILYLLGKTGVLIGRLGPGLASLAGARGAAGLGLLFGLNIPAWSAPLVFAVIGTAALDGGENALALGFLSLVLFGLALSAPIAVAVFSAAGRRGFARLAAWATRVRTVTGLIFVALGLWSIYFALFVSPRNWV